MVGWSKEWVGWGNEGGEKYAVCERQLREVFLELKMGTYGCCAVKGFGGNVTSLVSEGSRVNFLTLFYLGPLNCPLRVLVRAGGPALAFHVMNLKAYHPGRMSTPVVGEQHQTACLQIGLRPEMVEEEDAGWVGHWVEFELATRRIGVPCGGPARCADLRT
jgi:hypothetical protein